MKYNFVVFGSDAEYYRIGYSELNQRSDAIYLSSPTFEGKLKKAQCLLRKIHMSTKINKLCSLPCKELWNNKLYYHRFENEKPMCFIFFSAGPFADHIPYGFIEYLKAQYHNSKFVVFYQDLVGAIKRAVSIDTYKKKMDLVMSFDYSDCERYGMVYHPLVYSDVSDSIKPLDNHSDIYFCGAEKNRLNDIIEAYDFFNTIGFSCDFNVITSKKELLKKQNTGINYCSSFSYTENLRHIKSCSAMLEIMQKGGTGYTLRALECIAFNSKLITNNVYIDRAEFYNPRSFMNYDRKITEQTYASFIKGVSIAYEHMEKILPHKLLEFIEEQLE